ncbi:CoA ester lyase [Novosphingobium sp. SG720]|uniref:HpcH/HpaI aldolase/citrate lyase family protein n=1 Tax=Novosphingobium sp. SG720 TaxID=2586998 RepID=UPI001447D553|nr:CoA ester lyase [Novosphingobium sp. SG720]NKJ44296.1 citrate lyase subunit beta/citryl-CoA lyase [Novosphingobium sp. SG720]
MKLRSLLFVPGDRPDRFAKAAASGADAIILDLEDSVALAAKETARAAVADYLATQRPCPVFVRINPVDGDLAAADLAAVLPGRPDAIVLPKAEGAETVGTLLAMMGPQAVPILPIATETPAAVFELGSYGDVRAALCGLTWGAEDLPAAIGAATAREDDGRYTPPYELVRSLTLFAAHKAGVAAIETVYPALSDMAGLAAYAARGRRDGFTGMMALHPAQVPVINQAFTPTPAEVANARRIVALFEADPTLGVVQLDGRMIDRPHLKQARAILTRVD